MTYVKVTNGEQAQEVGIFVARVYCSTCSMDPSAIPLDDWLLNFQIQILITPT